MFSLRVFIAVILCSLAVFVQRACPAKSIDAPGSAELQLIGPDLKPLANTQVALSEPKDFGPPGQMEWSSHARTDGNGRISISLPAGVHSLRAVAPGIGFGMTGQFQVTADKPASVPLAALAPFGGIEGTVTGDLLNPGATVQVGPLGGTKTSSGCDATGHFAIKDLMPGEYFISVVSNNGAQQVEPSSVMVIPGSTVHNLEIHPRVMLPAEKKSEERELAALNMRPDRPDALWAAGTVRNRAGQPVTGAEVYAVVSFFGGLRMYEKIAKATTDVRGHYEVRGEGPLQNFSGTLIAYKDGLVPALAWISAPSSWESFARTQPADSDPDVDLIMGSDGGALDVRIVQAGKAADRAYARAVLEGGPNLYNQSYIGASRDEARSVVERIISPVVQAGPDGVAHFEHLLPGTYHLAASLNHHPPTSEWMSPNTRSDGPLGFADGVAVRAGQRLSFSLPIYSQPNQVRFKLFTPDGKPLSGRNTAVAWSSLAGQGWNSSAQFDADGLTERVFESPGFWAIRFAFRDTPTQTVPIQGPSYQADAIVAVTPLLDKQAPLELNAFWQNGASLEVQLEDVGGRPVPGVVLSPGFREPQLAATTDAVGRVHFEGLRAGMLWVQAYAPGFAAPDLGRNGSPLPTDAALSGHSAFISQQITLKDGENRRLVLKAEPIGYVRGQILPQKGTSLANYYIGEYYTNVFPGKMSRRYDKANGEFIYGPFETGQATVEVFRMDAPHQTVWKGPVEGGHVHHVRINTDGNASGSEVQDEAMIGMGGISMHGAAAKAAAGRIFLADGKSPAWGAMVETFVPEVWQPVATAMSDAGGALRRHGDWYSPDKPDPQPPGSPTEPVAVAWLPGQVGATVVALSQIPQDHHNEYRFVLPRSLAARGKVVWGGALAGHDGRIRVLAEHAGSGKLDQALSIRTTAQADGSFELAGLTPGRYRVQAAVDDVWISSTAELIVHDSDPPPLLLTVPDPGQPTILHLLDSNGAPIVNQDVIMDVPDGPLAKAILPSHFHSDGAGRVYLEGLAAGPHAFHLRGVREANLIIPQMSNATAPAELKLTFTVSNRPSAGRPD